MEALKANNWQADVLTIGLLKDTFDIFDRKEEGLKNSGVPTNNLFLEFDARRFTNGSLFLA